MKKTCNSFPSTFRRYCTASWTPQSGAWDVRRRLPLYLIFPSTVLQFSLLSLMMWVNTKFLDTQVFVLLGVLYAFSILRFLLNNIAIPWDSISPQTLPFLLELSWAVYWCFSSVLCHLFPSSRIPIASLCNTFHTAPTNTLCSSLSLHYIHSTVSHYYLHCSFLKYSCTFCCC